MCHFLPRWAIAQMALSGLGMSGCVPMTMLRPEVLPNGVIQGGEPRLRALVEMMSSGRPQPVKGEESKVFYAASVFPVETLVVLQGALPATKEHIAGSFSIAASMESAETAQAAVVVILTTKGDPLMVHQETSDIRWEYSKWIETTLLGIYKPEGEP